MLELVGLGAIAGVIPVYVGIVVALLLGKMMLPRSWEGLIMGVRPAFWYTFFSF